MTDSRGAMLGNGTGFLVKVVTQATKNL